MAVVSFGDWLPWLGFPGGCHGGGWLAGCCYGPALSDPTLLSPALLSRALPKVVRLVAMSPCQES